MLDDFYDIKYYCHFLIVEMLEAQLQLLEAAGPQPT